MTELLAELNMPTVVEHYAKRESVHVTLRQLLAAEAVDEFVHLALGIVDPAGNYSASEHRLGPQILSKTCENEIFDFAVELEECPSTHHLPELIYRHSIPYLKISVGTEMAMMLQPNRHWVGNIRTIWSHLLLKQGGSRSRANRELALYHDNDRDSEMEYAIWRDVYLALEANMLTLGSIAADAAAKQNVQSGTSRFMWSDAVASELFERFAEHE